jgi:hypothetical protein
MTHIRRITAALVTLVGALAAVTARAPAALAIRVPPPGGAGPASGLARTVPWPKTPVPLAQPPVHTVTVGGMPGWQIALIAVAAAVIAAAAAVILDRARAARRHQAAPSPKWG